MSDTKQPPEIVAAFGGGQIRNPDRLPPAPYEGEPRDPTDTRLVRKLPDVTLTRDEWERLRDMVDDYADGAPDAAPWEKDALRAQTILVTAERRSR